VTRIGEYIYRSILIEMKEWRARGAPVLGWQNWIILASVALHCIGILLGRDDTDSNRIKRCTILVACTLIST
jgi:hypothetical protein